MAERRQLKCHRCDFAVGAWSDGNPYYRDERGQKQYAYHPDHERLARCIGNDVPHLCLACGIECKVDSREPHSKCRKCEEGPLVAVWNLEGRLCPKCRAGTFDEDPSGHAIS